MSKVMAVLSKRGKTPGQSAIAPANKLALGVVINP